MPNPFDWQNRAENAANAVTTDEEDDDPPYIRYIALFEFAQGEDVSILNRQSQGQFMGPKEHLALGKIMAQLHQDADNFPNVHDYHRYTQDTSYFLLDEDCP